MNFPSSTRRIVTVDDEALAQRCARGRIVLIDDHPELVQALILDGWSDREIIGFIGENVLRVLESAEHLARKLAKDGVQPDNTSWQDIFGTT